MKAAVGNLVRTDGKIIRRPLVFSKHHYYLPSTNFPQSFPVASVLQWVAVFVRRGSQSRS